MEILSDSALCSLEDVKQYLNLESEVDQDDLLIRLVNAASEAIITVTQREFASSGITPEMRVFDVRDAYLGSYLYIGDFSDVDEVVIKNDLDEIVTTMDLDNVVLYPRNRRPWEPYRALRLRGQTLGDLDYVEVTGTWGFVSIPEEIRQAAIVTASLWYARDIERFGATFSISQDHVELPRAIPPQVSDTISRYTTIPVG